MIAELPDRSWPDGVNGHPAVQPLGRLSSAEAFAALLPVMAPGKLNALIGGLESVLAGAARDDAVIAVRDAGMSVQLLDAALTVRRDVGRVNDLIHALAIGLTLGAVLEEGESISSMPSLAAGNNAAAQRFDLETSKRAAEFKLSVWRGNDSQRARGLFGDLVNLAVHTPATLVPQLYVVGHRPRHWLTTTQSRVTWALNGASKGTLASFATLDAPTDITIPAFRMQFAARVEIVDLATVIPGLLEMLSASS